MLNKVVELLQNEEVLTFIADAVWEYYQKTKAENDTAAALHIQLEEIEQAQANIMKAVEAGLFSKATKKRMDELEGQRAEIEAELARTELIKEWEISREYITVFLKDMAAGNTKDRECQKQLIDTFVNAVFVYDDKITITFNYSNSDVHTITFAEVESLGTDGEVFGCCAECSTITHRYEHPPLEIVVYRNVFAVIIPVK